MCGHARGQVCASGMHAHVGLLPCTNRIAWVLLARTAQLPVHHFGSHGSHTKATARCIALPRPPTQRAPCVAGPPLCVVAHAGPGPCGAAVLLHCDAKFAGLQGQHNQLSWCATPMMPPAVHMQLCQFACSAFQYVATNAASSGHNAAALPTSLWRVQPRAPAFMLAAVRLPFRHLLSAL